MTIDRIEPSELPALTAALVREGVQFHAQPMPGFSGYWQIVFSGGF